jgi:flavin reductase (DIM6/NTAB) family NADH-FMN oxidoreductase RutF
MPESPSPLAAMLGRIPSGLFILAARNDRGEPTAMLVSWVQQAGFAPPAVTVAVRKGRDLHDGLAVAPHAALSIVGESQKPILARFSKGIEPGEHPFEGLDFEQTASDLPVLTDALGWLAGDVTGQIDAGDHLVYLLRVTEAGFGRRREDELPWVHLRKNGLGY